jgi:hypothetical protein
MSEAGSIIFWVLMLAVVYMLTRRIKIWRAARACDAIVRELEMHGAYDPVTAVALKGATRNWLRVGLRNFRPEGLKILMLNDLVGMTHDGKYYLKGRRPQPGGTQS